MAIEITPKKEIKKNLLKLILFGVSTVIFLFLAGSYFYFVSASNKLLVEIKEKEEAIKRTAEEIALEKELLLYQSKISDFGRLLKNHKKTLNIFYALQDICHPNVWFSDFTFASEENIVVVSGEAKGFQDLGQQLAVLKESSAFKKVKLTGISLSEGGDVIFSLQLNFNPEIFDL